MTNVLFYVTKMQFFSFLTYHLNEKLHGMNRLKENPKLTTWQCNLYGMNWMTFFKDVVLGITNGNDNEIQDWTVITINNVWF